MDHLDASESIDEIVDDIDPPRVERVSQETGLTVEEIMHRCTVELMARIA